MTERKAEAAFLKYKRKIINSIGNKETTDVQLNALGRDLFGSKYLGTYPQDKAPIGKTGMMIVNTDISSGSGIHWVAVYSTVKTIYVFDSYARPSSKLLKVLFRDAKTRKINIIDSDRSDSEQRDNTAICGQLSIAWLCVVKQMGIKNAMKI
jgi:hypothetical protein